MGNEFYSDDDRFVECQDSDDECQAESPSPEMIIARRYDDRSISFERRLILQSLAASLAKKILQETAGHEERRLLNRMISDLVPRPE